MSSHVVPQGAMDTAPIVGIEALEEHLQSLQNSPERPFNVQLIDDVALQLNRTSSRLPCPAFNLLGPDSLTM